MSANQHLTYRERRELKAERLREWAEKREAKAGAAYESTRQLADTIPFGQPILVGHHSEKRARRDQDRIENGMRKTVENSRKADEFNSRADNIEAQAANAIYSDDDDAPQRLEEKIATLEAKRDRIKHYNASCRKAAKSGGVGDLSILDEAGRQDVATLAKVAAYQLGKGNALPTYSLSNVGGNISRLRKRLESLKSQREAVEAGDRGHGKPMRARYEGSCAECGATVKRGEQMTYYRTTREVVCEVCVS